MAGQGTHHGHIQRPDHGEIGKAAPEAIGELSADEIQHLADRLYSRGVSHLSTDAPKARADLIAASRALRALLRAYERNTGRTLHALMLCGGA